MRRVLLASAVALALASVSGSASAGNYDPNAYCCQDVGLAVTSYVPNKSISVSWTFSDNHVGPGELHAGYTLVNGIIRDTDPGFWDGNIFEETQSAYEGNGKASGPGTVTFRAGADDTIGTLAFTKDFYVQIWYRCYYVLPSFDPSAPAPPTYCSHVGALDDYGRPVRDPEFYSVAVKVHVAAGTKPTNSGGGSNAGTSRNTAKATFNTPVTIVHADASRTRQATKATLRPGDVVTSGKVPVRMSSNYGTIALDRNGKLAWLKPGALTAWTVEQGTAYYSWPGDGSYTALSGDYASLESNDDGATPGAATITASRSGDIIRCYQGQTLVWPIGPGTGNVALQAGQQVTVRGKTVSPPKRFVPTRIFWK
jgi:hypothetical protein